MGSSFLKPMQMRKAISMLLVFFFLILYQASDAQISFNPLSGHNLVFVTPCELDHAVHDTAIKRIREPWGRLGRYIVAEFSDGGQKKFRKNAIWGYQKAEDSVIRRVVGRDSYIIQDTGRIIVYKMCVRHGAYYFSRGLDGKIMLLRKKKLLDVVGVEDF